MGSVPQTGRIGPPAALLPTVFRTGIAMGHVQELYKQKNKLIYQYIFLKKCLHLSPSYGMIVSTAGEWDTNMWQPLW